jgi:hypothetical protein
MDGWMEAELMWWSLPFEWRGATTSRMCLESNSRGVALGAEGGGGLFHEEPFLLFISPCRGGP